MDSIPLASVVGAASTCPAWRGAAGTLGAFHLFSLFSCRAVGVIFTGCVTGRIAGIVMRSGKAASHQSVCEGLYLQSATDASLSYFLPIHHCHLYCLMYFNMNYIYLALLLAIFLLFCKKISHALVRTCRPLVVVLFCALYFTVFWIALAAFMKHI